MSLVDVVVNTGKVIGIAGLVSVVINGAVYRNYAKDHLKKFENPLDETKEVLATFDVSKDIDEGGFFFGLATAPAHVEDELDDAWLEFAKETFPKKMKPEHKYPPFGGAGEGEAGATSAVKEVEDVTVRGLGESEMDPEAEKRAVSSTLQGGGEGEDQDPSLSQSMVLVDPSDSNGGQSSSLAESGVLVSRAEEANNGGEKSAAGEWEVVGGGLRAVVPLGTTENVSNSGEEKQMKAPLLARAPVRQRSRRSTQDPIMTYVDKLQVLDPTRPVRKLWGKVSECVHGSEEQRKKKERKKKEEEEEDEDDDYSPNVAAFHNVPYPGTRLKFWTEPDTELQLAQEANQSVFRLGVDWGRIMPREPVDGASNAVDWAAVKHYRWILERVRAHNMEIMLSLFHHSLPKWAAVYGGWKEEKTVRYFLDFSRLVAAEYGDLVKWYVTFNEPHVFAMLTYCAGAWPGANPNLLESATSALPKGAFERVMGYMADAHNLSYDILHAEAKNKGRTVKVGISHHVSWMRPYGLFDTPIASLSTLLTRFAFVDDVCENCEFIGINYYGQEFACGPGLKLVPSEEYSDSGRGVLPEGLYRSLLMFHKRYNIERKLDVPFYVTENGIADGTDYIRRPYILEHLLAIRAAMDQGVPVKGYLHWTTSDNWEWADGYGPKFGLVHVDRANNLKRTKRPSFYLYAEVSKTGKVTRAQRDEAWGSLMEAAAAGKERPFFRQVEPNGLMYAGGLDVPITRPLIQRDWRFGHYVPEGLQDPVSRVGRFLLRVATFGQFGKNQRKQNYKIITKQYNPSTFQKSLPSGAPSAEESSNSQFATV